MAADQGFSALRQQLDNLAARGARILRRWAFKEAVEASTTGLFAAALPVPVVFLLASSIGLVAGESPWPFSGWGTVGIALAVPLAAFVVRVLFKFVAHPVDRRVALALFDRELGYKDRIHAADEFLRGDDPTGFQAAAVEDAQDYVETALQAKLQPPVISGPNFKDRNWRQGVCALLILGTGFLVGGIDSSLDSGSDRGDLEIAMAENLAEPESSAEDRTDSADRLEVPTRAAVPRERAPARNSEESDDFAQPPPRATELGAVQISADQSGASGAGAQQNSSDNGLKASGQFPSREWKRQEQEASNHRPGEPKPPADRKPEDNNENSSATTGGKGRSSGSRTSSLDRQTDNKADREGADDEVYDDAEEEEDEEQEAAAAARPLLNQRKAPVDRSLSPSRPEAEEDPSLNGRGGPGGLKKTRGVAAMLLGVPMPDQLLGQANPGRMKVQRERSEPEERFSDEMPAADRGSMDETTGLIAHPGLLPWMQDLVRDYFLAERKQKTEKSESRP